MICKNVCFVRGASRNTGRNEICHGRRGIKVQNSFLRHSSSETIIFGRIARLEDIENALCNRPPNSSFCDTPRAKPSCLTYSWVHGEAHATAWHDFDIGRLRLIFGVQSDKRRVFARGVDEKHENASRIILGYLSAVSSFVGPKVVVSKARFRRTPQTKPPFWKTQLGYMCAVSSFGRSYFCGCKCSFSSHSSDETTISNNNHLAKPLDQPQVY